ncbi:MAG: hypothetical protein ACI9OJ_001894 [Myxococcota bacterium]|jgi:hypothetical protein
MGNRVMNATRTGRAWLLALVIGLLLAGCGNTTETSATPDVTADVAESTVDTSHVAEVDSDTPPDVAGPDIADAVHAEDGTVDSDSITASEDAVQVGEDVAIGDDALVTSDVSPPDSDTLTGDIEGTADIADVVPDSNVEPDISDSSDTPSDATEDTLSDTIEDTTVNPSGSVCTPRSPVLSYRTVAHAAAAGLYLYDLVDETLPTLVHSWDLGFVPMDPVAVASPPGAPTIIVALKSETSCRLKAFDAAGTLAWTTTFGAIDCFTPSPDVSGLLVVSTASDGSGELRVFSSSDGALLQTMDLSAAATASAGAISSGGSHWAVGVGPEIDIVVLTDSVFSLLATVPAGLANVDRVFAVGPEVLGVTGGSLIALLTVDVGAATPLTPLGPPIVAPSTILAPPVAAIDCGDIASGGSHWWCPAGIVVAGGDDWLAAWAVDGTPWFQHSLFGDRLTGLALADDGTIYSGGSHWTEGGGWRLRIVTDSGTPPEVIASAATTVESCIGSPVLDTAGDLAVTVELSDPTAANAVAAVRQDTMSPGLTTGWSRAGGDNLGSARQADQDAACPGSPIRLYERPFFAGGVVEIRKVTSVAIAGSPSTIVVAGRLGADGPDPSRAWLAGLTPGGQIAWEHTFDAGNALQPAFEALTPTPGGVAAATTIVDPAGIRAMHTVFVGADGALGADGLHFIPDSARLTAIVPRSSGGIFGVGNYVGQIAPNFWVAHVGADGISTANVDVTAPADVAPTAARIYPDEQSLLIVGQSSSQGGFAGRYNVDGSEVWTQSFESASAVNAVDALVRSDSTTLVAYTVGFQESHIRGYSAVGDQLTQTQVPTLLVALVTNSAGALFGLGGDFGIYHLNDVGAPYALTAHDMGYQLAGASSATRVPEGGFAFAGYVGNAFDPAGSVVARSDGFANTACGSAGYCAALKDGSCEDENPCTAGLCNPATGACITVPLDDGSACGTDLFCNAGVCQ